MHVLKLRMFAKYWLPVLIWAAVIYSASGDKKSVQHSSRLIEPFIRWLVPSISDEAVWATVLVVRKGAHMTEFAIFAALLWWSLRGTVWRESVGWSRRQAIIAWSGAVGFALTDEFHQVFVPGRQGSLWDVMIDGLGAALGLWGLWFIRQKLENRKARRVKA